MDAPDWPDQEALLALLGRLPADPTASADFAAAVYLPLLNEVRAAHRGDDPARLADVVGDLVLAFVRRPEQYDRTRLSVRGYLVMAANGDVLNARAKAARRKAREIPLGSVAEPAWDGKEGDEDDVRAWLADPRVAAVVAGLAPVERAVWERMLAGERSTAAFADLLGLADRPTAEQEREVKRVKDRVKTRLRRAKEAAV
jgi:DNA-directed RNA polymerase specialized sigma24 family protein